MRAALVFVVAMAACGEGEGEAVPALQAERFELDCAGATGLWEVPEGADDGTAKVLQLAACGEDEFGAASCFMGIDSNITVTEDAAYIAPTQCLGEGVTWLRLTVLR